jgi:hypothetical protein
MVAKWLTEHMLMSSILFFGIASIFIQAIMTFALQGYVKASANMKTTKKKFMINLRNQFETIYDMDYRVHNVSAYVDKYLLKLRFLGIGFFAWEKVAYVSAGLVTLLTSGILFYGYQINAERGVFLEIVFSYVAVLACFAVMHHIFGVKSKNNQIQIQLVDHLENYLANRKTRNQADNREAEEVSYEKNEKEKDLSRPEKEVAASEELSEVELLEEFVQSFLA